MSTEEREAREDGVTVHGLGLRTVVWDPEEARAAASREIEYGPDVHEEEH